MNRKECREMTEDVFRRVFRNSAVKRTGYPWTDAEPGVPQVNLPVNFQNDIGIRGEKGHAPYLQHSSFLPSSAIEELSPTPSEEVPVKKLTLVRICFVYSNMLIR